MFYFETDKREIRGWLKKGDDNLREEIREEILHMLSDYITRQNLQTYNEAAESHFEFFNDKISSLGQEINSLKFSFTQSAETVNALKREIAIQAQEIIALSKSNESLKKEVADLKQKVAAPQTSAPSPEVDSLKRELADLKKFVAQISPLLAEINLLKRETFDLRQKLSAPQPSTLPAEIESLKKELAELKIQAAQSAEIESLKKELAELKIQAAPSTEIESLKKELAELKEKAAQSTEIESLKKELAELKKQAAPSTEIEPPAQVEPQEIEPPEKIFYLPERKDVFIPNDRKQILKQIKAALSTGDIEKYLAANPPETSKKFQELFADHLRNAKKFVDKLKLNNLDDSELSEAVTANYFKLFHKIIFDNVLIAIKRGLTGSEKFYSGLLAKVNEYLARCGIYTVNTTSGRKAQSEDYENMSPQTLKTDDKTLNGTITEIERLPYRINYIDEFGEQKFLQYAGVMNVYKAV